MGGLADAVAAAARMREPRGLRGRCGGGSEWEPAGDSRLQDADGLAGSGRRETWTAVVLRQVSDGATMVTMRTTVLCERRYSGSALICEGGAIHNFRSTI